MIKYIVKRLLMMIPILLGISFIVLVLIDITPGDPARMLAGQTATPEEYAAIREELGLDDPLITRYVRFIWNSLHGDFGKSYMTKIDVWEDIKSRFPYTLFTAFSSCILALLIGIPLGVLAATNQNTWKDYLAILLSLICTSMPSFWFALMLVQRFAVKWRILPVSGIDSWTGWIMPIVSLALGYAASIARLTRSSALEVLRQDYIVTARAKGLPERRVLYRHVLKNSLIPVIVSIGSIFGMSLGGALIAETIYSIPGLGSYTLSGLMNRDYPIIQGSVLFLSTMFSIVILLIDIVFAFIDPRIRSQFERNSGGKSRKKAAAKEEAQS